VHARQCWHEDDRSAGRRGGAQSGVCTGHFVGTAKPPPPWRGGLLLPPESRVCGDKCLSLVLRAGHYSQITGRLALRCTLSVPREGS